jgi:hypothetical protein
MIIIFLIKANFNFKDYINLNKFYFKELCIQIKEKIINYKLN